MEVITDNTAVLQKTRELCQAILDQPDFPMIRRQVDAFLASEASKSQYQILVEKGEALQQKQQTIERVKELNNFALRAAEEQRWDQAASQLQDAIDLCRQCVQLGVLRKNMGLIYARKGDTEHAREELQIALKLLPNGPDLIAAKKALDQLQASATSAH